MELQLTEYKGAYPPTDHFYTQDKTREVVLGRNPYNEVCLKSVSISRRHAVITWSDGDYVLQEQKAVNRLYVNRELLSPGSQRSLCDGDVIQLGIRPNPAIPSTASSDFFVYKFTLLSHESSNKRKNSGEAQSPCKVAKTISSDDQTDRQTNRQLLIGEAAETAKKAEAERAALQLELAELKRAYDEQTAAKEAALKQEIEELQSKQKVVEKALQEKDLQMEESIRNIKDEQTKRSEEILKQLEEKERQLEDAKEQDKRLQQLEEALKVTREEQSRLGRECADEAVQKKIADLFEDQLMCAICSEMIVQPKSFPCSHTFCGYCIDKWLERKRECPVCRNVYSEANFNCVINSLIDRAVEDMSEESRSYRKSLIAAREAEMLEKSKANQSKGKKKSSSRRQPRRGRGAAGRGAAARGAAQRTPPATRSNSTTSRSATSSTASSATDTTTTATTATTTATTATTTATTATFAVARTRRPPGTDSTTDTNTEEPILISSDSEGESDSSFLELNDSSDFDEDNEDEWDWMYRRRTWGSYGVCYNCGDPGHWRPNCPYR